MKPLPLRTGMAFSRKLKADLKNGSWFNRSRLLKVWCLIINNLVSSMLWHRLVCTDPPTNLLSWVQEAKVDFFWVRLHLVSQSVLFLPKRRGGHGLVHLASRGASLRLRFIQRLLTGPVALVWRPVVRAILCSGLGLAESLFLMDVNGFRLDNLPCFL